MQWRATTPPHARCVLLSPRQRETVAALMDTVAAVHAALGITFEFVNVGGGIGIPYQPTQATVDVTQVRETPPLPLTLSGDAQWCTPCRYAYLCVRRSLRPSRLP